MRRAFHTLKGSSRMVGLKEFGEGGWASEQMYNAWLASHEPASADLLAVTRDLLGYFADWTEAIAEKRDASWSAAPVIRVADALRLGTTLDAGGCSASAGGRSGCGRVGEPVVIDVVAAPWRRRPFPNCQTHWSPRSAKPWYWTWVREMVEAVEAAPVVPEAIELPELDWRNGCAC